MRLQAFFYLSGNLLQRIYPFAETFLLTALLSVEDFGRWSWATSFYVGVLSFTHGGIPAATLRYSALHPHQAHSVLRRAIQKLLPWMGGGLIVLFSLGWTVPEEVRWVTWAYLPALGATLIGETIRSHLRGRLDDKTILLWQLSSSLLGLLLTGTLGGLYGLRGAALSRALQPLWGIAPVGGLLWRAWQAPSKAFPGFGRFGWIALWGNVAMEGVFVLPVWFLGWRGGSEILIAHWRWATLLPLSLRSVLAQIILYFYPIWTQRRASPWQIYRSLWPLLHGLGLSGALLLAAAGMFWETFPGRAYLAARPYYWVAILNGYLWSTEALALPNILSSKGYIAYFSGAYLGALGVAVLLYSTAGSNLWIYLAGLGAAGGTAGVIAGWYAYQMRGNTHSKGSPDS
ncbi:MAG: hypothetical protein N3E49_05405 [Bacteroidia bacterium]|nr:hypothetical protein [Bacteroidia bacterium]